ncbi:MAG: DUF1559 domain-containing protein [Planctomycetia bacterium]|jgi:prepilin-type processing-associated H-X9-DG protein
MKRFNRKLLCLLLAICMSISPSMVVAAQTASVPAAKADFSYIVPEAVIAGVAYPQRVLAHPDMELMPKEIIEAAGLKEWGFNPLEIESVLVMVAPPSPEMPVPGFGVVVRFAKPISLDDLKPGFTQGAKKGEMSGRPCLIGKAPMAPSFFMSGDKTLLISPAPMLKHIIDNFEAPKAQPVSRIESLISKADKESDLAVVADIQSVGPMLMGLLNSNPVPPPFAPVKRLPELISSAKIQAKVTGKQSIDLELTTKDEASAKEVAEIVNKLIDTGIAMLQAEMAKDMSKNDDPIQKAAVQYFRRISKPIAKPFRPTLDGKLVKFHLNQAKNQQAMQIGVLVALLLPAVQAAREAARRAASCNNLKQIALGMHNYTSAKKDFPQRANFDKNGKPLLSWRVHILPYIEQQELYSKFKLDEPWDSPHNKKLIPLMPQIYRNPSSPFPVNNGKADYLVPTGPGSIFEGQNKTRFRDITDGTSHTILAVEVDPDHAVTWTKPDDLKYDKTNPMAHLGKAHPGGFNAVFADGSVLFISNSIDSEVLLMLFQMNDGQPILRDF